MTADLTTPLLIQLDAQERAALRLVANRSNDPAWRWEAGVARQLIREALTARGEISGPE